MESKIAYLLDTDILVGLLRQQNAAVEKASGLNGELRISALSIYELMEGSYKSHNPDKAAEEAAMLIEKLEELDADKEVCMLAGKIAGMLKRKGNPIGDGDTLIGATALVHNLTVITRNTKHFRNIPGLKIEEW